VSSKTTFGEPVVVHSDVLCTGISTGLVVADDDSDLRYTFRAIGPKTETAFDADVSAGNVIEDATYPGVEFLQDQNHRVTFAARPAINKVEMLYYCSAGDCNDAPKTLSQIVFSGMRFGLSSHTAALGDSYMSLFFVRKYTANTVTAAVQ
jgi:hypothetical protein